MKILMKILKNMLFFMLPAVCLIINSTGLSFALGSSDKACALRSDDEWCPSSVGPITTWTAPVCDKGEVVILPRFFYNRTRGVFDDKGHYKAFKNKDTKSQYQEQLFFQYGITDKLEFDGQATYQQNLIHLDGERADSTGFSDTYLYLRYCVLDQKRWLPCIVGLFQLKMPTGKYQKASPGALGTDLMGATSGGGSYDHGYGIIITEKIKPFVFHVDTIYTFPIQARVDGVKTRYGDYWNYDFGVEYFFPKDFNLMMEFNGFMQGDKREDNALTPGSNVGYLNAASGVGWASDAIQLLLVYQRTLAGTNIDVNDSLIFSFSYTF